MAVVDLDAAVEVEPEVPAVADARLADDDLDAEARGARGVEDARERDATDPGFVWVGWEWI
jgi:hypothetical protein